MKLNRNELINALETVTPGIAQREIIEQSSCFVFDKNMIFTFNDEISCRVEIKTGIKGAVTSGPILTMLKKLTEDEIVIDQKDGKLIIKGKKKKATFTMEEEILLPIDEVEVPEKWKTLPDTFSDAVHLINPCASKDASDESLTCIQISSKYLQATDNYQAARFNIKLNIDKPILVRAQSLSCLTSLDMQKFSLTKSWIHFKNNDGLILSCRKSIGDFPKLGKIMKVEGKEFSFPKNIKNAIEKAQIFTNDDLEDGCVNLHIEKNKLTIKSSSVSGSYIEQKKIEYNDNEMDFLISPALLLFLVNRYDKCILADDKLKIKFGKLHYVTVLQSKQEEMKNDDE